MKSRARTLALVAVILGVVASMTPAHALPDTGPPTLTIEAVPTSDPFTFHLQAHASDPDGRIRSIQICVAEGSDVVCTSTPSQAPDPVADLQACVSGDAANYSRDKTFAGYGVFSVTAKAVGGGCPVVGSEQESNARTSVVVAPPQASIPCADSDVPTASDTGVTADAIKVATTVNYESAEGGGAASGIRAAVDHVNATGGVCGRILQLTTVDDGNDAPRGLQYFRNLIADGAFALVGAPSGESTHALIESGDVDAAGIPVVGTLGQTDAEFSDPWVFPVAPSSRDFGRIAVRHADEQNHTHIALVYSGGDHSSVEARQGVLDAIAANPGMTLEFEQGLDPNNVSTRPKPRCIAPPAEMSATPLSSRQIRRRPHVGSIAPTLKGRRACPRRCHRRILPWMLRRRAVSRVRVSPLGRASERRRPEEARSSRGMPRIWLLRIHAPIRTKRSRKAPMLERWRSRGRSVWREPTLRVPDCDRSSRADRSTWG